MSLVPPAVRGLLALSRRSSHCSPARHCSLGRRSDARHPPPHSAGLFREGLRRPAPGPAGWLRWRSKADSCTKHSIWCNRQGDCTLRHQIKLFGAVVAFTALSFWGFGSVPPSSPPPLAAGFAGGPSPSFLPWVSAPNRRPLRHGSARFSPLCGFASGSAAVGRLALSVLVLGAPLSAPRLRRLAPPGGPRRHSPAPLLLVDYIIKKSASKGQVGFADGFATLDRLIFLQFFANTRSVGLVRAKKELTY